MTEDIIMRLWLEGNDRLWTQRTLSERRADLRFGGPRFALSDEELARGCFVTP
jgi:hypothetical protein